MSLRNSFYYVQACFLLSFWSLSSGGSDVSLTLGASAVLQPFLAGGSRLPAILPCHRNVYSERHYRCFRQPMGINRRLMKNSFSCTNGCHPYRRSTVNSTASGTTFDSVSPTCSYKGGTRHSLRQWARGSLAAMSLRNSSYYVQVRNEHSLFARRSSNVCLLELLCPRSVRSLYALCYWLYAHVNMFLGFSDVMDLLLLRFGDVEANPGPMSNGQARQFDDMLQLLQDANARSIKLDQNQACLMESVQKMRNKQNSMETKTSEIRNRLDGAESKVSAFDKTRKELLATQELVRTVIKETRRLHERLDDIED